MRAALVFLTMLVLAGCTAEVGDGRPDDAESGAELLAHMTGRAHSGAFDVRAFPQTAMKMPTQCIAYRGATVYEGDSCRIITSASEHWFPLDEQDWGLMAQWKGRFGDTADDADAAHPRTAVAFDARGRPSAYWAGANHPDAGHATE